MRGAKGGGGDPNNDASEVVQDPSRQRQADLLCHQRQKTSLIKPRARPFLPPGMHPTSKGIHQNV